MATAQPMNQLISSDDVQGTNVYGAGDSKVGEIDHLVIEKISGRVAYAVMSFGGFLGLGESHYAVPWNALKYDTSLGGYRTGITEDQLKSAPHLEDNSLSDRNWEQRTYEHYGVAPYWNQTVV
ncbi:MAG: PRC-barrel domain-containing protein [Proteobacteria bacterium]|nr:PRC-barrel domain-containing protein [Pseudomonadota bacterium]